MVTPGVPVAVKNGSGERPGVAVAANSLPDAAIYVADAANDVSGTASGMADAVKGVADAAKSASGAASGVRIAATSAFNAATSAPYVRATTYDRRPGKKGTPALRPGRPRELARLVSSRTDPGAERCRRPSQEELERRAPNRGPPTPGQTVSRPFGPHRVVLSPPRASACGSALGSVLPTRWAGRAGHPRHRWRSRDAYPSTFRAIDEP
jgi:hypothetical protein